MVAPPPAGNQGAKQQRDGEADAPVAVHGCSPVREDRIDASVRATAAGRRRRARRLRRRRAAWSSAPPVSPSRGRSPARSPGPTPRRWRGRQVVAHERDPVHADPHLFGDALHAGEFLAYALHAGMPSSRPRRSTTALTRAVTSATSMPAWRSSTMPSPSVLWNDLDSLPSSAYSRRPSVSVPSTSKPITRMRAARSSTSAG